jgi:hypothetical protein
MIVRSALLLVSVPLLVHGADGLYQSVRSQNQVAVECGAFARARPASQWLRIVGCDVDYLRAGYRESGGRLTELFLPLTAPEAPANAPVSLVVATTDVAVLAMAEEAVRPSAAANDDAFLVAMLRVVTAMGAAREVSGLARSPLGMLQSRGALAAIHAPVADDVVVIDLDRRPSVLLPAIELAAAALALLVVVVRYRRRTPAADEPVVEERIERTPVVARTDVTVNEVPLTVTDAPPAAARPAEFRRLMLVNLPPSAAPSALEQAPPLGTQPSVRSAFAQVLPGITFDDSGRGRLTRPDHAIAVDLGDAAQVWTATVDVTGPGAPEALRGLITGTGWRAYAPRLGRFITARDLRRSD